MIESLQPLQSRTYWKSNLFKHCKLAGPFSGKIPGENSRRISREMAFFPVPMQMSFAWSHPYSFRKNLDIPFPSKQFPWKCLISRGFQFPCRKIQWNYRFPKSRANQTVEKKNIPAGIIPAPSACTGTPNGISTYTAYSFLPGMCDMVWFIQDVILVFMCSSDIRTAVRGLGLIT